MKATTARKEIEKIPKLERAILGLKNSAKNLTADSLLLKDGQPITWNTIDHTINIPTGFGTTVQVGQEVLVHVYNSTVGTLFNGKVVYPIGTSTNMLPNIDYCIANSHETIQGQVGILTADIPPNSEGFVTLIGKVRDIDTSALSLGPIYISPTVAGDLTSIKPQFPDYDILMGVILAVDAVNGELIADIRGNVNDTFVNFHNGTFRETFDFTSSSNGTAVTGSLSPRNGHPNLTMRFSDGFTSLVTTPPAAVVLIPGTDNNPQLNYVYIPKSTKVLTVSTSGFPITEHIKVASILLQSATSAQTSGVLKNQNYNDHVEDTITFQGHLSHLTERLRVEDAKWDSGVATTVTINPTPNPNDVTIATTGGKVYQIHKQDFPAIDTSLGADMHIVNKFNNSYFSTANLNTEILDANGVSLNNRSFAFVVWGVANKTGEVSHLMVNLPTNSEKFNDPDKAQIDSKNYSVYDIPVEFRGAGFLIARLIFTLNAGVWTLFAQEDLRGFVPNSTAGAGVGAGGVTTLLELTDIPNSYLGQTGNILQVNAGETAMEFVPQSGGGGVSVNIESLFADKTLIEGDADYQFLIPVTINRTVILPSTPNIGDTFWIKNNVIYTSPQKLIIKTNTGLELDSLYANSLNGYMWDGAYWIGLKGGLNFSRVASEELNLSWGHNANGTNTGLAIGRISNGSDRGTAIGHSSDARIMGVAVGNNAKALLNSAALGYYASTNSKKSSNALGYYSETERYGETSINIDGQTDQENNHGLGGLTVDTLNNTPTIMLAGGTAGQRFTIRINSLLVFDIQIGARDNVTGDCAAYQITGAIKRDGAGNTVIVGVPTKTIIAEDDVTWDVNVTADDVNNVLQIEVTGDATNTVQWVASIKYTETHF